MIQYINIHILYMYAIGYVTNMYNGNRFIENN